MATIINVNGSGSGVKVNLLASMESIPTSLTAVSGTEKWKEYDAIYFDTTMSGGTDHITSLVYTSAVITGENYYPYDNFGSANVCTVFGTQQISVFKWTGNPASGSGAVTLKIYGIK